MTCPRPLRTSRATSRTAGAVACVLLLASCDVGDGRALRQPVYPAPATTVASADVEELVAEPLRLSTPWADGATDPVEFWCGFDDVAPTLRWSNIPPEAVELAVTVAESDDPGTLRWALFGITADFSGITSNGLPAASATWPPDGDYTALCDDSAETNRYLFTLYALDAPFGLADASDGAAIIDLLAVSSIAQSSISGVLRRAG